MGLFDKATRKFKQAVGFDPTFGVAAGVESFIADPTGGKAAARAQANALRAAGRIEEAQRVEAELLRAQIREQFAPIREIGLEEAERLRAQEPGTTEFFRRGLERGTEAIAERAAGFGLLESGATRRGFGELGAELLTREEQQRQLGLTRAAQLAQAGLPLELGALGAEQAAGARLAQTQAGIGAAEAARALASRQFFSGILGQAGGLAGGLALGSAFGVPPAATTVAATQGGFDPFSFGAAQFPTSVSPTNIGLPVGLGR
jgi:hypothetical protein